MLEIKSELHSDVKVFVDRVSEHFDEYLHIPNLKRKLLGMYIDHLYGSCIELPDIPLSIDCRVPGKGMLSAELTDEQKLIKINIIEKIKEELTHFPRLVF